MNRFKKYLLTSSFIATVSFCAFPSMVKAEDCTGTLPGADCTLDEDTTAPLTIDLGVTLSVDTSVTIGHEIDGSAIAGDGEISTVGPVNINQTADIGANTPIEALLINDDTTWTTSGAIITDNDNINADATRSDIDLGAVDGGETLNFLDGSSYSGQIDGHGGDIVNFGSDGNGGDFVTGGQIESVTLIITSGDLEVNNTLGGGINLNSIDVADGASMELNANATTLGALDNDGQITIGAGNTLTADTYTADVDGGEFVINVARNTGATTNGSLSVANAGLDLSNDTVRIGVDSSSAVLIDETIANVIVGNVGGTVGPNQFVDDSFLYNFTLVPNGDNFDLTIAVNPLNQLADNANNLNVARVILGNLAQTDNAAFNSIQSLLASDSNAEQFNERLESLLPTVDGGYAAVSLTIASQVDRLVHNRVKTLYDDTPKKLPTKTLVSGKKNLKTGRRYSRSQFARQNVTEESGTLWIQPFLQRSTQDTRESIDGFDMTTNGIILGADSGNLHEDALVGIAAIASVSEVDSNNANSTNMEVQTFGLNAYAGWQASPDILVDGSVTYTHGLNDYSRRNVGGVSGNEAEGDFVSEHLALKSRISQRYDMRDGFTLTPSGTLSYDYIDAESFRELGLKTIGLDVEYQAFSKFSAGAGLDANWTKTTDNGSKIDTLAYIKSAYDFGDQDGITARSNFIGAEAGRNQFETKGFVPQKLRINAGGNLKFDLSDSTRMSAGYDFEYQEDFTNHTGHLNVTKDF